MELKDNMIHVSPHVRLCYTFERSDFFQGPRRLLDYLFLYLDKGRYVLTIEGKEYELLEGEFALIQPGLLFTTQGYGDCVVPNAHLDFFYNPLREQSFVTTPGMTTLTKYAELLQPRLDELGMAQLPPIIVPENAKKLKQTLMQMIDNFKNHDVISMIRVQQLAMELLIQLIGSSDRQSPTSDYYEHRFKARMEAYLSSNLSAPLSIADMAQHIGYSESHFCLIFKQVFGEPPHSYLVGMRVGKAQELLRSTDLHLEVIADYCGFANASHFSKTFKQITSLTPGGYRNSSEGEDGELEALVPVLEL
ncbi:AraC family transcriptional regulator [Paenibacillus sp. CF384]|uniref:AraC family transcriptional regulator n=1 Tax=Paenibacillus sp. CF384 TaxID=1884382 RepID=UPI000894809A|nr:AraC family transcriptional regulator [Paenibacillus sp. CF384]SDW70076.1 Helix-turn-helix domain-containing protein [Paenibacillus sp. CF384]